MVEHNHEALASAIRAKIEAGALPTDTPLKMWVGPANGRTACDGCGQRIVGGGLEYEIDTSDRRTFRFHRDCLAAWHQERVKSD